MFLITRQSFDTYMETDRLGRFLDEHEVPTDMGQTSQTWLRQHAAKRHVTESVYRDALAGSGQTLLDVGSGLTTLQRVLSDRNDLRIIEKMAHDPSESVTSFLSACPRLRLAEEDWHSDATTETYDHVIANDLFPNVDQRLSLFLSRYLPRTRRLTLSATFYQTPRFYETRRTNADEYLYYLAWDGAALDNALQPFAGQVVGYQPDVLRRFDESIFPNGRSVAVLEFRGGLA